MNNQETQVIPARSAGMIITQPEELAAVLMKNTFSGSLRKLASCFVKANARAKHCWRLTCEIQEMLTDADPEDALSEMDEDELVESTGAVVTEPSTYLVVQEGGSSVDIYTHVFDTEKDAKAYRSSSADDGSYRTSAPILLPISLTGHPAFGAVAEAIAKGAASVDFPDQD
jgi:hypothetical protein